MTRKRILVLAVGCVLGRAFRCCFADVERNVAAPRHAAEKFQSSPIREAEHEAKARPDIVDRADLVVDEAGREDELARDVLVHVGDDARGALGPRDPEAALRGEARGGGRPSSSSARERTKRRATSTSLLPAPTTRTASGNAPSVAAKALRRAEDRDATPLADAELLRERRAGIPCHVARSLAGLLADAEAIS